MIDYQKTHVPVRILHNDADPLSISSSFSASIYEDPDGTLWFCTWNGISKCNPDKTIYAPYQLPFLINELQHKSIIKVNQNPADKSLWLRTDKSDLIWFKPDSREYRIFRREQFENISKPDIPFYINSLQFAGETVVVTTTTGSWQLQPGQIRFKPLELLPEGFKDFFVKNLLLMGDSVICFASTNQVLYYNRLSGETRVIGFDTGRLTDNTPPVISGLYKDRQNRIWTVVSFAWIAGIKNGKLHPELVAKNKNGEVNGGILTLDFDNQGNIWFANTWSGLTRYNPASGKIDLWTEAEGLYRNMMQHALVDHLNRVWVLGENKISVFDPSKNAFHNFAIPIGESALTVYNNMYLQADSTLVATIGNEVVRFFPSRLQYKPAHAKPQISSITVVDKEALHISQHQLELDHDQNTLHFKFGMLTDRSVFPYDFEYMLDGAEGKWTTATESNEAIYNNLRFGSYVFRVRARAKDGTWLSEEETVSIVINTPFYRTAWFYALTLLLVSGLAFFLFRYWLMHKESLMKLESKAQLLEKEKAQVMYENLKQQLNPHFLFNSLTSLNSLIAAEPASASEFLESLSKTYRYILKSRDSETVPLVDEIGFAENYVSLQKTRFETGFEVVFDVPEEYHHRKVAPVTLQNLIENAIKHNIIDAESPLVIKIFVEDDCLVVQNNLQKKRFVETSNRQGLANMQSLYRFFSSRPVEITESQDFFTVKIPLL